MEQDGASPTSIVYKYWQRGGNEIVVFTHEVGSPDIVYSSKNIGGVTYHFVLHKCLTTVLCT